MALDHATTSFNEMLMSADLDIEKIQDWRDLQLEELNHQYIPWGREKQRIIIADRVAILTKRMTYLDDRILSDHIQDTKIFGDIMTQVDWMAEQISDLGKYYDMNDLIQKSSATANFCFDQEFLLNRMVMLNVMGAVVPLYVRSAIIDSIKELTAK